MSINKQNKWIIPVMSFSAGTIVANVYYSQPILRNIAESLGKSENAVGKIAVLAQLGYGLGMFFLLPLGDKLNRKKLILSICLTLIVMLLILANTTNFTLLLVLSFIIGVCSTPAQIILPMSAALGKENRGKNVGIVFSGILCGILGSRLLSGALTDLWGWQSVFLCSAILVSISSLLLFFLLPEMPAKFKGSYFGLLKSTISLIGQYKILRQASLLGSFTFGVFCSFWTTLTFHLSEEPFHYPASTIGLFGLIAIGGALVAPYFGKMADKGQVFKNLYLTVGMLFLSILVMWFFPHSIWVLIIAIFFLDIGVQATQITNFTRIYSLDEQAHSRLNTVYMTTYFIGAGTGTFFGLLSWSLGGWDFALSQMLIWSAIALGIVWLSSKNKL
ncbi:MULTISPECIES: MFS transporter [Sphingobacterium]|uniref:MFS transporter n=1 Tax=Sphingobacterium anhuiense TaxID=493780 RepID=A0ABW5YUU7_9SPHI|nr:MULTISPECIES: MFS transporter [Sphingobacterium]KKX49558.1 MFS transporter [Sphingobacterium sp. IITKGP-BTPF85]MBB2950557.1 putative MFS family arabinose efflux permease [Sphingobacterium sp. JUb56]MCS3552816.1 putative MFS family arabinose efflux permease [Sphingobacterium sp. JUb21]MCW2259084.1 putative MFS family arabinose efflux permease [Sphingobacterium kitahiroshimense]TCR10428.1 putative MFS family arabinose efflux permease [Sphingobacterium sp. JUb20]